MKDKKPSGVFLVSSGFLWECVQSREEVRSGSKTAVTSRVSTPSHQSDFHLLSALHLAARVLLRGRGGGTDLNKHPVINIARIVVARAAPK